MGKGDTYRPVDREKYGEGYDRIFRGVESEIPTATQVECTAIVKRSDVWLMSLGEVDLTKMDHPTACKYLIEGMQVRILGWADDFERGWQAVWIPSMTERIGKIYTIDKIEKKRGITFKETGRHFPAFCLQIIEQENNND